MKKIYIAGPYNAGSAVDMLENMRRGMKVSKDVFLAGMAPFCPWLDYHYTLMLDEGERISVEQYYEYSIAWLLVSDAMIVLPGSQFSVGVNREISEAVKRGIPICFMSDYNVGPILEELEDEHL